jgi:ATP-dependent Clp protease ATP-binding subunit ClpC
MPAAAREAFLPEFVNRIDEIVTFSALPPEHVLSGELADGARVHAHAGDHGEIVIDPVLELAHA